MSDIIKVILISALPIIEQKGAIPIGLIAEIPALQVYLYTLLGAIIPSPFILKFIPKIFEFLKRFDKIGRLVKWYEKKAMHKGKNIAQYELVGLLLFVAIPLPGTGVWTGSLVASLLGLDFKKSFGTVIVGAAICGGIIMLAAQGAITFIPWLNE